MLYAEDTHKESAFKFILYIKFNRKILMSEITTVEEHVRISFTKVHHK